MREITSHGDGGVTIRAVDGGDGEMGQYMIRWRPGDLDAPSGLVLDFVNGVTSEALLAVVIDRLTCEQSESYSEELNETVEYLSMGLECMRAFREGSV